MNFPSILGKFGEDCRDSVIKAGTGQQKDVLAQAATVGKLMEKGEAESKEISTWVSNWRIYQSFFFSPLCYLNQKTAPHQHATQAQ